MLRRPSATESSASSSTGDVTFDDVDDGQVFAFMDEGDRATTKSASRGVEFRLDFSSRVNPAPIPVSSPPLGRRSSSSSINRPTSKQAGSSSPVPATNGRLHRSPSMRSSTALPFRKRLSRHPSDPPPDAVVAAALKAAAIRPESPPSSPPPSPVPPPLPMTVGPQIVALPTRAAPQPVTLPPKPSPPRENESTHVVPPVVAASTQVIEALQAENEALRADLQSSRALIADLHQRVRTADQQTELLQKELTTMEGEYVAKTRTLEDEIAAQRVAWMEDKESALASAQEHIASERRRYQSESDAALTQVRTEMQQQVDRMQRFVDHHKDQNRQLEGRCARLQESLLCVQTESLQRSEADASLDLKCESLQASVDHWEAQCQSLQDHVHQLLHEQQESHNRATEREREYESKIENNRAIHVKFAGQVQSLQAQLKTLGTEAKDLVKKEIKRMTFLLAKGQQQASELAMQYNHRAMALAAKKNRIIQLETQLKNERQTVNQLEATLAKTTRTLQRKEELFKSKYQEQKEFLDITVVVRNGLSHELQSKRAKMDELEQLVQELTRSKEAMERKNRHLSQQVKIMQHMHVREMEQVVIGRQQTLRSGARRQSCGSIAISGSVGSARSTDDSKKQRVVAGLSSSLPVASNRASGDWASESDPQTQQHRLPEDDEFAAEEWREFMELTALHEAECDHARRGQWRSTNVVIST